MSYTDEKIMIGLSGGINSMAVLCHLVESGQQPKELHLFYAHFDEHSPDTMKFVLAGMDYAKTKFKNVITKITDNSILKYFKEQKIIPHPMVSPCTRALKIEPIITYAFENQIKYDLVGYVKEELKRRGGKQQKTAQQDMFSLRKDYPIGDFSDEWCFEIVDRHIGWHPKIYDILDKNGKRVFKHNNCLPCKNMNIKDMEAVRQHYPEMHAKAMQLSEDLEAYWGRDSDTFYSTFGRELGQDSTCNTCKW